MLILAINQQWHNQKVIYTLTLEARVARALNQALQARERDCTQFSAKETSEVQYNILHILTTKGFAPNNK